VEDLPSSVSVQLLKARVQVVGRAEAAKVRIPAPLSCGDGDVVRHESDARVLISILAADPLYGQASGARFGVSAVGDRGRPALLQYKGFPRLKRDNSRLQHPLPRPPTRAQRGARQQRREVVGVIVTVEFKSTPPLQRLSIWCRRLTIHRPKPLRSVCSASFTAAAGSSSRVLEVP